MRVRGYAAGTPCLVDASSPDPVAAQGFYGALFGWGVAASPSGCTLFRSGEWVVAGLRQGERAQWLTYFATEDLATTAKAVAAAGGVVLEAPSAVARDGARAVFADPTGATFAAWQRDAFAGVQVNNEPNAMCWSELATRDLASAGTFYNRVFAWSDRPDEWQADPRGTGGIAVAEDRAPAHVPAVWTVCFMVSDCDAAARRAAALGGRVEAGPRTEAAGRVAQLADPHGARFTVIEPVPEVLAALL
jgi:uncharacterized protein